MIPVKILFKYLLELLNDERRKSISTGKWLNVRKISKRVDLQNSTKRRAYASSTIQMYIQLNLEISNTQGK